jgi:hypothetical protein
MSKKNKELQKNIWGFVRSPYIKIPHLGRSLNLKNSPAIDAILNTMIALIANVLTPAAYTSPQMVNANPSIAQITVRIAFSSQYPVLL